MLPHLLVHECGHYLGLLHTFEGGCKNDDCEIDGDMVCDTPPDLLTIFSCGDNSCDTDTLSNYSNGNFLRDRLDSTTKSSDQVISVIDLNLFLLKFTAIL